MGMRATGGWGRGWGAGWLAGMVYRARGAQATLWGVQSGRRVWGIAGGCAGGGHADAKKKRAARYFFLK